MEPLSSSTLRFVVKSLIKDIKDYQQYAKESIGHDSSQYYLAKADACISQKKKFEGLIKHAELK